MKRQRGVQSAAAAPEQPQSDGDVAGQSPYLLTIDAARLLCFDRKHDGSERPIVQAMHLFREWAARNRVPELRRGRTLLYERRVLAAFLEQRGWTKKHAGTVAPRLAVVKSPAGGYTRGGR